MISFAAEFPVAPSTTREDFIDCIRTWISGMRRSKIKDAELKDFGNISSVINSAQEKLELITALEECAARYTLRERGIEWRTDLTFAVSADERSVSVRVYREADQPTTYLPDAKTPYILKLLLTQLGTSFDGDLQITSYPNIAIDKDLHKIANTMWGASGNRLPMVYVSHPFGGQITDGCDIAKELQGRAHVWVETARDFSRKLQTATENRNAYGGSVGVYWPNEDVPQIFYMQDFADWDSMRQRISQTISNSWIRRKQTRGCSWEEISLKGIIARLDYERHEASNLFSEAFDDEVASLKQELAKSKSELIELRAKLQASEFSLVNAEAELTELQKSNRIRRASTNRDGQEVKLSFGEIQEAFPGEVREVIIDAINTSTNSRLENSRRQHIVETVIHANPTSDLLNKRRTELKKLLTGYVSMTGPLRSALKIMGFEVAEDGKHIKLTYMGDARYMFTMPKSGSDHRGGLNAVSDISKRVF